MTLVKTFFSRHKAYVLGFLLVHMRHLQGLFPLWQHVAHALCANKRVGLHMALVKTFFSRHKAYVFGFLLLHMHHVQGFFPLPSPLARP